MLVNTIFDMGMERFMLVGSLECVDTRLVQEEHVRRVRVVAKDSHFISDDKMELA